MKDRYLRDYYMSAAVEPSGASQAVIAGLKIGDQLKFVREPENPDNRFAIRIETMSGEHVGYVSKIYSQRIFVSIEYGVKFKALVDRIPKGRMGAKQLGLDLRVLYTVPDLSKLKKKTIKMNVTSS